MLDHVDQVASIALFGPAGDGKYFVARTLLHDQTKARLGRNCHFMRCDLTSSLEGILERRLPDTIDTDRTTSTAELRSHLGSPPQFILLFNGVSDIERLRRMLEYGDNTFLGMRESPGGHRGLWSGEPRLSSFSTTPKSLTSSVLRFSIPRWITVCSAASVYTGFRKWLPGVAFGRRTTESRMHLSTSFYFWILTDYYVFVFSVSSQATFNHPYGR